MMKLLFRVLLFVFVANLSAQSDNDVMPQGIIKGESVKLFIEKFRNKTLSDTVKFNWGT